jgi:hypothetical protein
MTIRARGALCLVASAIALLTVGATSALADDQYGGVAGETTGGGSSSGTLPFTGADLVLYAVIGVAIVASGLVLRRIAAGRSRA